MSRLPSPLAWHPLLTLGFGTPHAKILHAAAGWGPGQGWQGTAPSLQLPPTLQHPSVPAAMGFAPEEGNATSLGTSGCGGTW